jgi:hypothetical protein
MAVEQGQKILDDAVEIARKCQLDEHAVLRSVDAEVVEVIDEVLRADCSLGPHVAVAELVAMLPGYVLLLGIAEAPDLVALNSLARQVN